ncbi:MurR/RpiR family transcriptional regulator [Vagococcus intermedius]|uniref:MurR/RpiR family transcriptional regulator n=1 Tax=Vagococcus intermedius TaxID=2991418 RepID=A0AAF0I767_9ENTE|nr:MurR/RpiR family transcriptional regulator [Vagococcus intermedius]WEG73140.1 MurR/RpiR family transcriptional regulator [Vagococcus intermedius]WEG75224.1 MurR/RpiR family transcriptional regulator [Vagococcus intermedius]
MLFLNYTPDFNDLEMGIYKYVATNIEKVVLMRIRELAEVTHCSTATILRFCRKFDCEGFSEFKIKLRLYLDENLEKYAKAGQYSVDTMSLTHFITRFPDDFYKEKIEHCLKILDEKELVWFLGYGSSNIVAEYGAMYFSSLVNMSVNISDTLNQPLNHLGQGIGKNTCVIVLSVGGETKNIIQQLNQFLEAKSQVISITNSPDSTIAKLSDVNIPYYIKTEKIGDSDVTSQIPVIYILEYLAKEYRRRKNI